MKKTTNEEVKKIEVTTEMSLINYGDNYNLRYANQDPEDMFDGNDLILTKEQYDILLPKFKRSQALAWERAKFLADEIDKQRELD